MTSNIASQLKVALDRQNISEAMPLAMQLGDALNEKGDYETALNSYILSTRLCQELGDQHHLVHSLYKLSYTYFMLSEFDKAVIRIKRGLELTEQTQSFDLLGKYWALLGDTHYHLDNLKEAQIDYEQANKILYKEKEWYQAGVVAGKLATLHLDQDQPDEATVVLAQAVTCFEKAQRKDLQARALGNLGTAFGKLGRWTEAGQRHTLALSLAKEIGDQDEEAYQLENLGYVAEMDGHLEWAVTYYRQSLYLYIVMQQLEKAAQISTDIARLIMHNHQQIPQAMILLEAAAKIDDPYDETLELLKEVRQTYLQLKESGYRLPTPIGKVREYAEIAYQQ